MKQEQLLIELLDRVAGGRVLTLSVGRGQLAGAAAERFPEAQVSCWFLDLYRAELAAAELPTLYPNLPNLQLVCDADLPEGPFEAALLPLSAHGEAELTRELMQQAHERLEVGGLLAASTDNVRDTWLHAEMRKLFARVERCEGAGAVAYLAHKTGPLKKVKDFGCEVVFRDESRLLRAYTRPGVFAHRRVDPGARRLLEAMDVRSGDRVLDLGCGSGVVALAAAARSDVEVRAVDTNARAIQCTEIGAAWNELENVVAELTMSDQFDGEQRYQLVLANPPYYSHFRIAQSFLEAADRSLAPGGRLIVVTKSPEWYLEEAPQWFDDVHAEPVKGYAIVTARAPQ